MGSESGESRAEYSRVIDEDNLSDSGIGCNGEDQTLVKQFKLENIPSCEQDSAGGSP